MPKVPDALEAGHEYQEDFLQSLVSMTAGPMAPVVQAFISDAELSGLLVKICPNQTFDSVEMAKQTLFLHFLKEWPPEFDEFRAEDILLLGNLFGGLNSDSHLAPKENDIPAFCDAYNYISYEGYMSESRDDAKDADLSIRFPKTFCREQIAKLRCFFALVKYFKKLGNGEIIDLIKRRFIICIARDCVLHGIVFSDEVSPPASLMVMMSEGDRKELRNFFVTLEEDSHMDEMIAARLMRDLIREDINAGVDPRLADRRMQVSLEQLGQAQALDRSPEILKAFLRSTEDPRKLIDLLFRGEFLTS